jgi:hypothetical protein
VSVPHPSGAHDRAVATATKVGDRVERAIEDRADFEREVERGETAGEPERRHLLRTVIWLGLTAVSLYLVAPSLLDVLGSWRDLQRLAPMWLVAMAALQALRRSACSRSADTWRS